MPKMPHARHDHRQILLIGSLDNLFVPDTATWLDNRRHARLGSHVKPISEREKSVRRHDAALEEQIGLHLGQSNGIDTTHLTSPDPNGLRSIG